MRADVLVVDVGTIDMGVYLRRRNVGVAEYLLDNAQIRSPAEQVRGKRMAKRMGMEVLDPDGKATRATIACALCRVSLPPRALRNTAEVGLA